MGGKIAPCEPPQGHVLIRRPSERKPLSFIMFLARLGRAAQHIASKIRPNVIVLSVPKYEMLFFAPALSKLTPRFELDFGDSFAFLDYGAYLAHFLPRTVANSAGTLILKGAPGAGQLRKVAFNAFAPGG